MRVREREEDGGCGLWYREKGGGVERERTRRMDEKLRCPAFLRPQWQLSLSLSQATGHGLHHLALPRPQKRRYGPSSRYARGGPCRHEIKHHHPSRHRALPIGPSHI